MTVNLNLALLKQINTKLHLRDAGLDCPAQLSVTKLIQTIFDHSLDFRLASKIRLVHATLAPDMLCTVPQLFNRVIFAGVYRSEDQLEVKLVSQLSYLVRAVARQVV